MAKFVALLLFALIAFSMVATTVMADANPNGRRRPRPRPRSRSRYGEGSVRPEECGGRCDTRCSGTQYHNACIEFCNKCCKKCLCVPPGLYGNKEVCPCYNNWKTKEGGPKCP